MIRSHLFTTSINNKPYVCTVSAESHPEPLEALKQATYQFQQLFSFRGTPTYQGILERPDGPFPPWPGEVLDAHQPEDRQTETR